LPRPADLGGLHQTGVLQHPDVLLHAGQRHAGRLGQLADRLRPVAQALEDGAAGGVGQGGEHPVERVLLNHVVHHTTLNQLVQ
jgi:hypothetical protein